MQADSSIFMELVIYKDGEPALAGAASVAATLTRRFAPPSHAKGRSRGNVLQSRDPLKSGTRIFHCYFRWAQ